MGRNLAARRLAAKLISRQSILFGWTQWAEFAGAMQTLSHTRFDGVALMPITGSTGGTPSPPDMGSNAIPAASQVDAIAYPAVLKQSNAYS